jgi:hypothetical protein
MSQSKSQTPIEKTSELLDEDRYWSLIQQAQDNTEDLDEMEEYLVEEVEKLTPKEMVGFYLRTHYFLDKAYTSELWCAGYIINGGCSDDGFEYFRLWLISAGKDIYYKAVANPDSLADVVETGNEYEFEGLTYAPITAFESKTSLDLYDYIDEDTVHRGIPDIELTWEEDDSESQKKICPRLYAMFAEE